MDISGLGKPITKLIEVIAAGVGKVTHSYFLRKDANAKAYAIKQISQAINESQQNVKGVTKR